MRLFKFYRLKDQGLRISFTKNTSPRSGRRVQMSRNKKRIGHSIAAAHSNDFAALQRQKSCVSVQHFAPVPLFGRARSTSRYRMPPVLPSVGPEATLRTPDFRLPAIRPTFILRPFRTNLSTPKIKKVANECLQPSRPPGRLRRERDSNPRYSCPYTAFRVRPDRPLRHLSFDQVAKIMIRSDYRCISGQKMLEILLSEQHASP